VCSGSLDDFERFFLPHFFLFFGAVWSYTFVILRSMSGPSCASEARRPRFELAPRLVEKMQAAQHGLSWANRPDFAPEEHKELITWATESFSKPESRLVTPAGFIEYEDVETAVSHFTEHVLTQSRLWLDELKSDAKMGVISETEFTELSAHERLHGARLAKIPQC